MGYIRIFKIAVKGIMMHRMRAFLTILGIIFGIASVISMVSVSEGAKMEVISGIEALGISNIFVRSEKPFVDSKRSGDGIVPNYGIDKLDAERFPEVFGAEVRPVLVRDVKYDVYTYGVSTKVYAYAVNAPYFDVMRLEIVFGEFFSVADEEQLKALCVIGSDVAKKLFPVDAIGRFIKIEDHAFKVIGVLKDKASVSGLDMKMMDINSAVFIPFESWLNRLGPITVKRSQGGVSFERAEATEVVFNFDKSVDILEAGDVINEYFNKTKAGGNYKVVVPYEILRQREEAKKIFTLVMVSISSLALIVGGIGIMNIMLASILERIKEIGTRRALGATRSMILMQFLSESVVLSVFGGILGICAGVGLSYIISAIVDWEVVFTITPIVISFFISFLVGVVFGTYPAMKAANLNPIEALRSE